MSSRSKGQRTVKKAIAYLESEGFVVDDVEKKGRYLLHKDLFSKICDGFDLIALKPKLVVFIQVKTNKKPLQKTYKWFARKYASREIQVWSLTWMDRKGFVKQKYNTNGTITETVLY